SRGCDAARRRAGAAARRAGPDAGIGGDAGADAVDEEVVVRSERDRSSDVRRRSSAPGFGRAVGVLDPGAAGYESRPNDGTAIRVRPLLFSKLSQLWLLYADHRACRMPHANNRRG